MSDKITATELESKLGYKKANFYEKADEAAIKAAYDYAPGYMAYLDAAKTEREAVTVTIEMAEKEGYVPYTLGMPLEIREKPQPDGQHRDEGNHNPLGRVLPVKLHKPPPTV